MGAAEKIIKEKIKNPKAGYAKIMRTGEGLDEPNKPAKPKGKPVPLPKPNIPAKPVKPKRDSWIDETMAKVKKYLEKLRNKKSKSAGEK